MAVVGCCISASMAVAFRSSVSAWSFSITGRTPVTATPSRACRSAPRSVTHRIFNVVSGRAGARDVPVATNVDDNGGEVQHVKRTSLADFLNRQPQK